MLTHSMALQVPVQCPEGQPDYAARQSVTRSQASDFLTVL
jgi:hypothetical protein